MHRLSTHHSFKIFRDLDTETKRRTIEVEENRLRQYYEMVDSNLAVKRKSLYCSCIMLP